MKWKGSVVGEGSGRRRHRHRREVWTVLTVVVGLVVLGLVLWCGVDRGDDSKGKEEEEGCGLATKRWSRKRGVKVVALAMMEGTGEVWVRGIVERVTNIATGSLRCEEVLVKRGFVGECQSLRWTAVVLTTEPNTESHVDLDYGSALYIVRNPFDVIASQYFLSLGGKSEKETVVHLPLDVVVQGARRYKDHYHYWTKDVEVSVLTVRLEDLRREPLPHIGQIGLFLGKAVSNEIITCASRAEKARNDTEIDDPLFSGTLYFDPTGRKFVLEYLREELCELGYFYDFAELECGAEWQRLLEERTANREELDQQRLQLLSMAQSKSTRRHRFSLVQPLLKPIS